MRRAVCATIGSMSRKNTTRKRRRPAPSGCAISLVPTCLTRWSWLTCEARMRTTESCLMWCAAGRRTIQPARKDLAVAHRGGHGTDRSTATPATIFVQGMTDPSGFLPYLFDKPRLRSIWLQAAAVTDGDLARLAPDEARGVAAQRQERYGCGVCAPCELEEPSLARPAGVPRRGSIRAERIEGP